MIHLSRQAVHKVSVFLAAALFTAVLLTAAFSEAAGPTTGASYVEFSRPSNWPGNVAYRMLFDGIDGTGVRIRDEDWGYGNIARYIGCYTPAHAAGTVDVTVINTRDGTSTVWANAYTYVEVTQNILHEETWVTNGAVHAIAATPDTVYLGGEFTFVQRDTGNAVALDTVTGEPADAFPRVGGPVDACMPDGSGGWYIGGDFMRVGVVPCSCLAHIMPDGSLDAAWHSAVLPFYGSVNALALSGSALYVGGSFTTIGGQTRNNIAAVDATTGLVTDWNPGADRYVGALSVSGATVYVGGSFERIGGQTRRGIAALDATTGSATPWDPASTSSCRVYALAATETAVFVGGNFLNIGGQPRNFIAAIDPSTALALSWNPGASNDVFALAVSDSAVYVGGVFTNVGGQSRNYIAAIDISTGAVTNWDPNASWSVYDLAVSGSTIYVGGGFTSIGGQTRWCIAALDAATGLATAWDPKMGGSVYTLAVSGTRVYAGGSFTGIGGRRRNRLAALDARTGAATDWDPNADDTVSALAISGSTVYVGGGFRNIGGQARNFLAALDARTGLATPWNPSPAGGIYALAVSGASVYVGGSFTSIGGQARTALAEIDATTVEATAWNPGIAGNGAEVRALAFSGQTLFAGGYFSSAGGQTRNGAAAFDLAAGATMPWDPNPSGPDGYRPWVYALASSGPVIYMGGASLLPVGSHGKPSPPWTLQRV